MEKLPQDLTVLEIFNEVINTEFEAGVSELIAELLCDKYYDKFKEVVYSDLYSYLKLCGHCNRWHHPEMSHVNCIEDMKGDEDYRSMRDEL